MPIYKTLEKSFIKESIFLYLKRIFFRRVGVFTSLDVAILGLLYVTVHRYFEKRQQFMKIVPQFVFISSTRIKCEE